jgi:hypothetical protein
VSVAIAASCCKDKNPSAPKDELSGAELWKALGKSPIRKRFAHLHFWAVVFDGFSVIAFVGIDGVLAH